MSSKWLDDEELQKILGLPPEEAESNTTSDSLSAYDEDDSEQRKEVEAYPVQFEELSKDTFEDGETAEFELLYDIPLEVRVLLGSVEKSIEEILDLKEGDILTTEQLAGEPVRIMVGEQVIARGEVVTIDDKFGVLITEIVPPRERIRRVEDKLKRQKQ